MDRSVSSRNDTKDLDKREVGELTTVNSLGIGQVAMVSWFLRFYVFIKADFLFYAV